MKRATGFPSSSGFFQMRDILTHQINDTEPLFNFFGEIFLSHKPCLIFPFVLSYAPVRLRAKRTEDNSPRSPAGYCLKNCYINTGGVWYGARGVVLLEI